MKKYIKYYAALIIVFFITLSFTNNDDNDFQLLKYLEIYNNVLKQLRINYVDTIDAKSLIISSIRYMLTNLDPYTNFYSEDDIEEAKFEQQNQYIGIGIEIWKIKDYFYITTIKENSPAEKTGLKVGDKLLIVNNKKTAGYTFKQLHNLIKGEPNTYVNITIERAGKELNFRVKREIVKQTAIPYYRKIGNYGYILYTGFYQRSSYQLKKALTELLKENIKGIIIDLRNNPGGLLSEAVNSVNFFIPQNLLVVYSKGKAKENNFEYKTLHKPIVPNLPLIILINEHSASASEIFSGTMQDYDRGVIIGKRSVGKGLVQRFYETGYNSTMKITVAKYYIPSGRCIQAIDYKQHKNYKGLPDSLLNKFKTKNGRIVYESKGIKPDIEIKDKYKDSFFNTLQKKYMLFLFAREFYYSHQLNDSIKFQKTDIKELTAFLKSKNFTYKSTSEKLIDSLLNTVDQEHKKDVYLLQQKLHKNIEQLIFESFDAINHEINLWLAKMQNNKQLFFNLYIKQDEYIDTAIAVLNNQTRYNKILNNQ